MGATAQQARMLAATAPMLPPITRRATLGDSRLRAVLALPRPLTQSEAAYVAQCEAQAEAMEQNA